MNNDLYIILWNFRFLSYIYRCYFKPNKIYEILKHYSVKFSKCSYKIFIMVYQLRIWEEGWNKIVMSAWK